MYIPKTFERLPLLEKGVNILDESRTAFRCGQPSPSGRGLEIGHFGWVSGHSPFSRRGGCAHQRFQKCAQTGRLVRLRSLLMDFREALLMELRRLRVCLPTAPSAPIRTLRDILFNGAATPPWKGGMACLNIVPGVGENGQTPGSPLGEGGVRARFDSFHSCPHPAVRTALSRWERAVLTSTATIDSSSISTPLKRRGVPRLPVAQFTPRRTDVI
jgi:hypothetical protein